MGLKLLHSFRRVVNKSEAGGFSATKLGAEAKNGHLFFASLVHACNLVTKLILRDAGAAGVEDVTTQRQNDMLAPIQHFITIETAAKQFQF